MPYETKKLGELLLFNAPLVVGMFILTCATFIHPTSSFASHLNFRTQEAFHFEREELDEMAFNQTEQVTPARSPNELVSAYLAERIEECRRLVALRREVPAVPSFLERNYMSFRVLVVLLNGWVYAGLAEQNATEHFENERRHADHPDEARKTQFYNMTCKIGQDLNTTTRIMSSHHHSSRNVAILDVCMAPGGFTTTALRYVPTGHVCGVSLPASMGGHEVRVPNWKKNKRLTIQFLDITMLAAEMGVDINTKISAAHPDVGRFSPERPFMDEELKPALRYI